MCGPTIGKGGIRGQPCPERPDGGSPDQRVLHGMSIAVIGSRVGRRFREYHAGARSLLDDRRPRPGDTGQIHPTRHDKKHVPDGIAVVKQTGSRVDQALFGGSKKKGEDIRHDRYHMLLAAFVSLRADRCGDTVLMMSLRALSIGLAITFNPAGVSAQDHMGHSSPYTGFETRAIKSLSESDLKELRRGGGWGLALPAELNGVPGPAHLLDLSEEIPLFADQVAAIQRIFDAMRSEAIAAGARLIEAEDAIGTAFQSGDLDERGLRALIGEAEAARADLRFIHLSRHLSMPPLLSAEQIARYNILRGYRPDPCANVPNGHDAEMWRRLNNCG